MVLEEDCGLGSSIAEAGLGVAPARSVPGQLHERSLLSESIGDQQRDSCFFVVIGLEQKLLGICRGPNAPVGKPSRLTAV
jgi:hypothetical protein